ncbi:unnamed protein product [Miscanthus lutarioriparius]|uniref:PRONE domain-containing protein n=1 Tax=Miscanthus lutarioriparius TaxID=422564 RepID=A0A811PDV9_9POAL|nr:unnamed protein product [Miscanthus lutarioriparius]
MVGGFLRRGHSLDRFLSRRRRAVSPSPSFSSSSSSSSPSSPRGSSVRSGMAEDDDDAPTTAPPPLPLQKRVLSRSHGSRATPGRSQSQDLPPVPSRTIRDSGPPSELDLMKEKFAKLLLGEDMSGTGKGVSSALALSNAITNLAASIFGEQRRLEPMSAERRSRWNKEIDWLLSVADHIVEFAPSQQVSEDGTNIEVMGTQQRGDLLVNIPALRKLDAMLLEYLDSFGEAQEFWYVAKDADGGEDADDTCDKWWIPTVRVPAEGLSEASRKWLQHQKELVGQVLKADMAINADVLGEMEIPDEYIESLPKNGRSILGDSIYKIITDDVFDPNELLQSVDLSTEHKIVDLKDRIEASVVIWHRKICHKLSWAHAGVSLEKREEFEERAQTALLILKHRFPGIPQSSLDISKIQYNTDVGYAILESYSRTLESLAFAVLSRIEDVLHADAVACDPNKRNKSRRRPSLESPVPDAAAEAHHGSCVHWQDQDAEDGEKHPDGNNGRKLKKIHRVVTKKFLHTQQIDNVASGLKSFTHR